jgi:tRNA (cmo5U34)-methyltransferase
VDLGAGTGLLTKEIYEMYNDAHYTLVDISIDMLNIARQRFDGLNNFEFIEHNYTENIPIENCDFICSALSIHHLENNYKEKLYKNIYKKLDKNGCFMNLDIFIAESKVIDNMYNEWWFNYINENIKTNEEMNRMNESRELDKENTINETLKLLKKCGFKDVECIYNFMKFGAIIAIK